MRPSDFPRLHERTDLPDQTDSREMPQFAERLAISMQYRIHTATQYSLDQNG